jgi:DNA repair exonuclease SbcCD ATPase subunit
MENITDSTDKLSEEIKLLNQSITQLTEKNTELEQKNSRLEISLEDALQKINWFEEQYKLMRERQFGKSSEKLSAFQQEIIFNADDTLATPPETSDKTINVVEETETITYSRRKKNGRNIDTSKFPRVQEIHDLSAEQKICSLCGNELHKVRDDISEQIEIIPRQPYVVEHICPQ